MGPARLLEDRSRWIRLSNRPNEGEIEPVRPKPERFRATTRNKPVSSQVTANQEFQELHLKTPKLLSDLKYGRLLQSVQMSKEGEEMLRIVMSVFQGFIRGDREEEDGDSSSHVCGNGTPFNLFTGTQTFAERKNNFEVSDTVSLHCGIFNENGGFIISDEDKKYMRNCQIVVSACAFGGGDNLTNLLECLRHQLKRFAMLRFGMMYTRNAGSRGS
ncbi:hypothetical protein Bca52824_093455 [Brassica carinata]|uniref:TOD1/MUCI70 glycosyltransferase-like domain-containing protein n=1 Tax=Brassica carinata TaxID=52824 RepID=A0A8X7P5J6_BRACI|nr:hypothetical protein Bca52824_093455 [Brassica carinata]